MIFACTATAGNELAPSNVLGVSLPSNPIDPGDMLGLVELACFRTLESLA